MNDSYERLITVFRSVFDGAISTDQITPASRLTEDIGINSIGMLYMAMALEEEFGVRFQNEDFAQLQTVQDVIHCLEQKQA